MTKRYRAQFGLRSALFVFVGLSIFLAWFGYKWRQAQAELSAAAYFDSIDGICTWDYETDQLGDAFPLRRRYPQFLRSLLGDAFGHHVVKVDFVRVSPVRDDDLPLLKQFGGLKEINFENASITDKGLWHLSDLDGVTSLSLDGCQVGDEGLLAISKMRSIHTLSVARTRITDEAATPLAGMDRLTSVNVSGTSIGDEFLKSLPVLPHLYAISAYRTQVTKHGLMAIRKANPNCEVRSDIAN